MAYIETTTHYSATRQVKESYDEVRKLLTAPAPPGFIIVHEWAPQQPALISISQIVSVKENL